MHIYLYDNNMNSFNTEAKDEYITRYLEGSIGRATWGNVESTSRPSLHCADKDEGPLSPSAVSRLPPLAISSDEASQLGYMSNRDDFERVSVMTLI